MKGSARGFLYLVIGILVAFAALIAINFGMEKYYTEKLKKEAWEVMELTVNRADEYTDKSRLEEYALAKYKEKGYKDKDLKKVEVVLRNDGSFVLYNEFSYVSIWGSISQKNDMTVRVSLIGYKDKYSQWQIEEYNENKEYAVLTTTAITAN